MTRTPSVGAESIANPAAPSPRARSIWVRSPRDPAVVGLRRVLIAEQPRHPSLAATWRSATVDATVEELTAHFTALQRRGLLRTFPAASVARQFLWMLIGDALDVGLLDPSARLPPARSTAENAVKMLLAAYQISAEERA
ncbi:TetR/AcrR family transcriptional regulator C-terminal domain-containing protein [Microbacterium sp. CCNWLW134]|uniref:TetR/AcrR family transcriptional regulator C-terminal domain-containing protein n=1 Tax=Microbacterium sp. CCNWLW134 TaxID=3122064 RepID=UPI00300FE96C